MAGKKNIFNNFPALENVQNGGFLYYIGHEEIRLEKFRGTGDGVVLFLSKHHSDRHGDE